MNTYDIHSRGVESSFEPLSVYADSIEQAATLVARDHWGQNVTARRVTGADGLSGVFQSFEPVSTTSSTSIGGQFHVMEH